MECLQYWDGPFDNSGPCLKTKDHVGEHEHRALCNNVSCICGGLESRMGEPDRSVYRMLRDFQDQIRNNITNIERKYYRFYTELTLSESIHIQDDAKIEKEKV